MPKQMLREQPEREEPVGLLLAAVRRRIRQVVRAEAVTHRLSPQQFWSLGGIDEAGPISLGALAGRLRMDQPTASRVVASLTTSAMTPLTVVFVFALAEMVSTIVPPKSMPTMTFSMSPSRLLRSIREHC